MTLLQTREINMHRQSSIHEKGSEIVAMDVILEGCADEDREVVMTVYYLY